MDYSHLLSKNTIDIKILKTEIQNFITIKT